MLREMEKINIIIIFSIWNEIQCIEVGQCNRFSCHSLRIIERANVIEVFGTTVGVIS